MSEENLKTQSQPTYDGGEFQLVSEWNEEAFIAAMLPMGAMDLDQDLFWDNLCYQSKATLAAARSWAADNDPALQPRSWEEVVPQRPEEATADTVSDYAAIQPAALRDDDLYNRTAVNQLGDPTRQSPMRAYSPGTALGATVAAPAPESPPVEAFATPTDLSPTYGSTIRILRRTFGFATPGMFVGMLGPSGAGKTTLLNILAGRTDPKSPNVGGTYILKGTHATRRKLSAISGFVEQFPALYATDTVAEAVAAAANLRLPHDEYPRPIREAVAALTLQYLGISNIAGTLTGGPTLPSGLSGGETRRVSIGIELAGRPQILFLDEPTTGLDTNSAYALIALCRGIAMGLNTLSPRASPAVLNTTTADDDDYPARHQGAILVPNADPCQPPYVIPRPPPTPTQDETHGVTANDILLGHARPVIATVHQPPSLLFELFDMITVVGQGRTVYFGPARWSLAFMKHCGLDPPPEANPADFLIDTVARYSSNPVPSNAATRISYMSAEMYRLWRKFCLRHQYALPMFAQLAPPVTMPAPPWLHDTSAAQWNPLEVMAAGGMPALAPLTPTWVADQLADGSHLPRFVPGPLPPAPQPSQQALRGRVLAMRAQRSLANAPETDGYNHLLRRDAAGSQAPADGLRGDSETDHHAPPLAAVVPAVSVPEADTTPPPYASPWGYQVGYQLGRIMHNYTRDPVWLIQLVQNIVLSFIVATLFITLKTYTTTGPIDLIGAVFFTMLGSLFGPALLAGIQLVDFRRVFWRETDARMYSPSAYWVARIIGDMIFKLVFVIVGPVWSYWVIGSIGGDGGLRPSAGYYFLFITNVYCLALTATSLSCLLAAFCTTRQMASAVSSVVNVLVFTLGGFSIINPPGWWIWFQYIDYFRYSFKNSVWTMVSNRFFCVPGPNCPFPDGNVLMSYFGINPNTSYIGNLFVVIGSWVLFNFAGYFAYTYVRFGKGK